MSRAFVSDKEDWAYCAKAGERCVHAEAGRACRIKDCPHYGKEISAPGASASMRVVARREKRPSQPAGPSAPRSTKRANVKPPRRWGGRSGR